MRQIKVGAVQESHIFPLIFIVYINDIPTTPGVQINLFVDDLMMYVTITNLQQATKKLPNQIYPIVP